MHEQPTTESAPRRPRGRPRKHPAAEYDPNAIVPGPADAAPAAEAPPTAPELVMAPPGHQPSINLTVAMFQELLAAVKAPGADANPALVVAIKAIESQAKTTDRLADEFKRTVRRSNDTATGLSVFTFDARCDVCKAIAAGDETAKHRDDKGNDLGMAHPKPVLRHETFFCGGRQREEQLTPLELELFNAFEGSKEARDGKWTADLARDGSKRRLMIMVPARGYDEMIALPPLTQILAELLYGSDVASPDAALSRIAQLEARIKELESARLAS